MLQKSFQKKHSSSYPSWKVRWQFDILPKKKKKDCSSKSSGTIWFSSILRTDINSIGLYPKKENKNYKYVPYPQPKTLIVAHFCFFLLSKFQFIEWKELIDYQSIS